MFQHQFPRQENSGTKNPYETYQSHQIRHSKTFEILGYKDLNLRK